ncbi:MAG: hypothetical protein M3Y22_03160 [Pseudomonadota bacterium]|nr:hypothetical protein [Pseudomonadota bacterium]
MVNSAFRLQCHLFDGLAQAFFADRSAPITLFLSDVPDCRVAGGIKTEDLPALWADLDAAGICLA